MDLKTVEILSLSADSCGSLAVYRWTTSLTLSLQLRCRWSRLVCVFLCSGCFFRQEIHGFIKPPPPPPSIFHGAPGSSLPPLLLQLFLYRGFSILYAWTRTRTCTRVGGQVGSFLVLGSSSSELPRHLLTSILMKNPPTSPRGAPSPPHEAAASLNHYEAASCAEKRLLTSCLSPTTFPVFLRFILSKTNITSAHLHVPASVWKQPQQEDSGKRGPSNERRRGNFTGLLLYYI